MLSTLSRIQRVFITSSRRRGGRVTAIIALAAVSPGAVHAQAAFSTATVGVGALSVLDSGSLDEFWKAPITPEIRISAPFYFGAVSFGLGSGTYRARSAAQPDFESNLITAGWSAVAGPAAGFRLRGGVQAGAMTMDFDDDETPTGNVEETELLIGLETTLHRELPRGLGIELSAAGRRVFTRRRIDLFTIGVAATYTAQVPGWLKGALE